MKKTKLPKTKSLNLQSVKVVINDKTIFSENISTFNSKYDRFNAAYYGYLARCHEEKGFNETNNFVYSKLSEREQIIKLISKK